MRGDSTHTDHPARVPVEQREALRDVVQAIQEVDGMLTPLVDRLRSAADALDAAGQDLHPSLRGMWGRTAASVRRRIRELESNSADTGGNPNV